VGAELFHGKAGKAKQRKKKKKKETQFSWDYFWMKQVFL
jgi:hypothetical protein